MFFGPQLVLVDIDDPGRIIFQFPVMEDIQALQDNDARMKEVSTGFLSLNGHFIANYKVKPRYLELHVDGTG